VQFNKAYSTQHENKARPEIPIAEAIRPAPNLPLEIWKTISVSLKKNTFLLRMRRVCKHWRAMGDELLVMRGFDMVDKLGRSYCLYCCSSKGRNIWERDLYVNRHYSLEQFTLYIKGRF
jgi:hypothetical protein